MNDEINAENNDSSDRDADFAELQTAQPESGPSSGDDIVALKKELDRLKKELDETKDKHLRALAEIDNQKKRALKDRSELLKYQGERVLSDMLEVMDNLEYALRHQDADPAQLKTGLAMIHKIFTDILGKWEVRAESAIGTSFDPFKHQAISKTVSTSEKPGTVLDELKKTYFYKDKLLRIGDVVVSEAPKDVTDVAQAGAQTTENNKESIKSE